jgi:hypothetical protein
MKDMKRGNRLTKLQVLKKKRIAYWADLGKDPRRAGILAHTPALCSCWMCGNPRKFNGRLTIQELIQLDKMNSYL